MSNKLVELDKSNRALKIRIYPDEHQKEIIEKTFGCCRFIYNNYLYEKSEFYNINILPIKNKATKDQQKEVYKKFKRTSDKEYSTLYPWMKDTSSTARHEAIRHLDAAFTNFFNNVNKKRKVGNKKNSYGFPKFKSKKSSYQSYSDRINDFNFFSKTIKIPKCGKIKFSHSDLPKWWPFKIKINGGVTISRTPSGKYYASILFTVKNVKFKTSERESAIGLDFSPQFLYVDSNGSTGKDYGYIAQKQAYKRKLKILQRKFAKKVNVKDERYNSVKVPSKNKQKAKIKLAKLEEKIANKRKDFIEKETLRLVRSYDRVVVEDLNLKGISSFLRNAKNMNDTSCGIFISRLEQKGKDYGCNIIKADKYFPSSKTCSKCGYKYNELKLSEREWTCKVCGQHHIRDVNAAINLKNYVPAERRKLMSAEDMYSTNIVFNTVKADASNETGTRIGDYLEKIPALKLV